MEEKNKNNKLRKVFESLPDKLQDAIVSVKTADSIDAISKKYNLNETQTSVLAKLTGRVLLGILHPNQYAPALHKFLNTSIQNAQNMFTDINKSVFSDVRKELYDIYAKSQKSKASPPAEIRKPNENKPLIIPPKPKQINSNVVNLKKDA